MTEEEMNIFIAEFLKPQINQFAAILEEAQIAHHITLSDGLSMGIAFLPKWSETEIFATFFQIFDDEEEDHTILRLSVDTDGTANYVSWSFLADEIDSAEKIDMVSRLFLSGLPLKPYPDSDENAGENTAGAEEEDALLTDFTVLPRLQMLSLYLEEEDVIQSGVVTAQTLSLDLEADAAQSGEGATQSGEGEAQSGAGATHTSSLNLEAGAAQSGEGAAYPPFIQLVVEDLFITLSYRQTDDENVFLFCIRVDIPMNEDVTEEEISRLCNAFNAQTSLVHANKDVTPFEIYGLGAIEDRTICLTAAFPEFGGIGDADHYFFVLELFMDAVDMLLNM